MHIVLSVRAECPSSPDMQRRSKSTEFSPLVAYIALELSILNLSFRRLSGNDLSVYRREPRNFPGLGIISKLQTFSTECSALPGKDQKVSLRRKAVFQTGKEH